MLYAAGNVRVGTLIPKRHSPATFMPLAGTGLPAITNGLRAYLRRAADDLRNLSLTSHSGSRSRQVVRAVRTSVSKEDGALRERLPDPPSVAWKNENAPGEKFVDVKLGIAGTVKEHAPPPFKLERFGRIRERAERRSACRNRGLAQDGSSTKVWNTWPRARNEARTNSSNGGTTIVFIVGMNKVILRKMLKKPQHRRACVSGCLTFTPRLERLLSMTSSDEAGSARSAKWL